MNKSKKRESSGRSASARVALCGILTALALIFSYVEVLVPFSFGVPGIKLGLSNLIVLIGIYQLGGRYAFTINMTRILLSGLLFGGLSAMLYSFAGGLVSFGVMMLLIRTRRFSPVGVSMAGGVFHNVAQITVAALVTQTISIYFYLPVLLIAGMITGTLLGIAGALILRRMKSLQPYSGSKDISY